MNNLLEVKELKTFFNTESGIVKAVNDVSFKVKQGETVCIVGESGCGKSMTAMSIMRLVSKDTGFNDGGEIFFEEKDLLKLSDEEMRNIRGKDIAMIFQEPMSSLNPTFTIGMQIMEPLILHKGLNKSEAKKKTIELLKDVGIPRAEQIIDSYPHELSGGMRQRVMIAMGLSCNPKLLIADEPTTALDVTIQAQILDLMREIKEEFNTSILLITHDLGVVAEMADYVVVMYAGKVIEEGPVLEIFKNPCHPYTLGLLKSKPVITQKQDELYSIPGQVPQLINIKDCCYFNERCDKCMEICKNDMPKLYDIGNGHKVACCLYNKKSTEKENR
ncbi:ABC transporter ATP-binding protein [Clostridium butyricum]|uniref:ABC transporter ATP-binding protein n=1 Tax=Clostridium butyricum TaxID=1492 RepID=UPI00071C1130|nr:ABC transporter ATP-binding protein [Clostridium butyricum]ALP88741.1 dipeptide/oligopeptide/nickel ABC transporter ATP-binding protein [Clostridium butyricum]ALS18346.1 dipeptide/oligopeptide/nickel ABC transporter ATP-binding protein [Clostridium butyricum]ANF15471.1 dipeptide/oligopeptide/nickel ABC transporter ATP-binding protein [Clostridium butyricum]AOR95419.1 dipeptide/oligopeptide/nickel ABC transporter ATP-binding protein [Clostridium butyricum]MCI3009708.1 ABC transporter ATP-bin